MINRCSGGQDERARPLARVAGAEALAPSYSLLDMTVYGRQEVWEDSPPGWPQPFQTSGEQFRANGRPTAQWSRLAAGHSHDLGTTGTGRRITPMG